MTICRAILLLYGVLYVLALGVALVGSWGLFGVQPDGLAAVYLIALGVPWTFVFLPFLDSAPLIIGQISIAIFPLINIWLLRRFCRR